MGLPEPEVGGPGGGGMGLPDDDVGAPLVSVSPGADAARGGPSAGGRGGPPAGGAAGGRGGPPAGGAAGGRGGPPAGGAGRPGGGAAGRGGRAAGGGSGARGGRGASVGAGALDDAAGRATSSSRRGGRGGCSLPDDVTRRPGGAGGGGRPAVRWGGAAGGMVGRGGFHPSLAGPRPLSGEAGAGLAARAEPAGSGCALASLPADAPEDASDVVLAEPVALPPDLPPPLAGLGSSGCSARTSPSRSARRRTRSACASSMPEECVLTPIPSARERSSVSLFVIPSSFASSWTRIFAAKVVSDQPFVFLWARTTHLLVRIAALHLRADRCSRRTGTTKNLSAQRVADRLPPSRNARANALRRMASARHASRVARQTHAPRPGSVRPSTGVPSLPRTKRTS
jgi:hypothetical protein